MVLAIMFCSEAAEILKAPAVGNSGDLGEVGARHADHLGVGAAGADLHPVVVHQLDGDVAIGQQLDVVVELARGDGAGAGLLHLGRAAGADGLVEIGGGDGELVVRRLEEEVREDGDGGFALDHGLRRRQFAQKFGAGDGDFEVSGGRGWWCHCGLLSLLRAVASWVIGVIGFSPVVHGCGCTWAVLTLRAEDRPLGKLYTECGANGTISALGLIDSSEGRAVRARGLTVGKWVLRTVLGTSYGPRHFVRSDASRKGKCGIAPLRRQGCGAAWEADAITKY